MRCGKCKATDVAVSHVRVCYGSTPPTPIDEEADVAARLKALAGDAEPMWPASEAQRRYVLGLEDERILPDNYKVHTDDDLKRMERDEVSGVINLLKTFTSKGKSAHGRKAYTMPEGRYALVTNGTVMFYEVNRPEKGRWVGYTFVNLLIGAPGNYIKGKLGVTERERVLGLIEADPQTAAERFGKESGTCFRCHSPLTDPDSLARSMGPVCARKVGW